MDDRTHSDEPLPEGIARLVRAEPELAAYLRTRREAESMFELAFEHAPVGIAMQELDGRFVRVNRALCELLGYSEAELLDRTWESVTHPDDVRLDPRLLETGRTSATLEKRYLTAAGEVIWASVGIALIRGGDGTPLRFVTRVQDISDRKRLEEDLRHAADHDQLTGLLNRRRFERDLLHQVAVCHRYGQSAALILLDLDRLKEVNDTHGHAAGDALLLHVGRVLSSRLRASDIVARLAGDEFAVLLPLVTAEEALQVAEMLVEAIAADAPYRCTASAGVAMVGPDTAGAVFEAADRALYAAKRAGRAQATLAESAL